MLKTITAAILFIALTLSGADAQTGLHVGANFQGYMTFIVNQNNYGRTEFEYAATFGTSEGISAGYNFNQHLGFQVEALYGINGQKYELNQSNVPTYHRHVRLEYMHFPLLFKWSGGGYYTTRFYVMAGPQYSILLYAQESFEDPEDRDSYSDRNTTKRFQNYDIGVVFDLGSDFTLTRRTYLNAGLRLNAGFVDINKQGWRLLNRSGIYSPSHNAWGGIHVGLNYVLTK